ncbi:HAMP domain-containing sensor histidine kinase [Nitratireductor sp.]|uniref:sensor histidine kinase n=1 Tax=Nitratireductor sp. TaxID=1872084 RepID=UPI00262510AF|nr:HAMP domain-containing sensor histidine kinase [Nitratireductor sp.]MCV0378429.1 HAMP domain-containing histidine kinase [Nitratireductor sp.]
MKVKRGYVAVGLVILGFALTLSYAFFKLMSIQRDLADYTGESMLWSVMQAEREARKLASHMLLPHDERDEDAVLLQLDILNSRLSLLKDNPQHDYLVALEGAEQTFSRLIENLSGLERSRVADPTVGPENHADILTSLNDFVRLSNTVLLAQREQDGARRDRQLETIYLTMSLVIGILLVGGYMAWQLLSNLRALDRANLALAEHSQRLEETVDKRTAALRTALENEQHTNAIYKNFLTTISHQFRTPITIIDMIAQRFIRRAQHIDPAVLVERSQRIRHAAQRLTMMISSTITNDMLNEQGAPLKKENFDLRGLVENVCADHRELFPARALEVTLPDGALHFEGDEVLIEQILSNFLANAEKYSPSSQPIKVRLERQEDELVCAVSDHGIGIPAAERGRIFDRFFRASNVAHLEGTGLGLSLSRTLARLHGGDIEFEPVEPAGTIFSLKLPWSARRDA